MKVLRTVLAALMLAFASVQLNDPDGFRWTVLYAAVGVALAIAAWRGRWLDGSPGRLLSLLLVATLVALLVLRWPGEVGFWRKEIWWESETAREGMGLAIALLASLFVLPVAFRGARRRPNAER